MIADLTGMRALVTGGGTGIGRGIAEVLAAQGAWVLVTDLDEQMARDIAADIGAARAAAARADRVASRLSTTLERGRLAHQEPVRGATREPFLDRSSHASTDGRSRRRNLGY